MEPGEIYDSLAPEDQDMSRVEFVKRLRELTDPRRMRSDLNRILRGKNTKRQIDGAVEK